MALTQHQNTHPNGEFEELNAPTYTYSYSSTAGPDLDEDGSPDGGYDIDGNGTGEQSVIRTNKNQISGNASLTVAANDNGMSIGPLTVTNGSSVTVSDNATWTII